VYFHSFKKKMQMLHKLGIGLVMVVAFAATGNLRGQDPEHRQLLRAYLQKERNSAALPVLKTEIVQKELGLTDAHLAVRNYL
jgi:hypothetical protein